MQQNDINAMTMIACLGGKNNIISVTNCMTRLRVTVKDPSKVDEEKLRSQSDVMGLFYERENYYEIVVGPGKSRKYADSFHETDLPAAPGRLRAGLKTIGEIFVPLIPGIITAGLCAGFASLIAQIIPDYNDRKIWGILYQLFTLINSSFIMFPQKTPASAGGEMNAVC